MRIAILGYIIRGPYGGLCWDPLQFVLGLKRLGHEVLFLEDSDDYPGYANTQSIETAKAKGFAFIDDLFTRYDLKEQWSYFDGPTNSWYGLPKEKVLAFCAGADILLNISGVNPLRDWLTNIPCRIFLDTDPLFTQVKLLQQPALFEYAKAHTCFFTIGENVGQADCKIPTEHFDWKPTKQPVIPDLWEVVPPIADGKWTTIMAWKSYQNVVFAGEEYGMKDRSFNDYLELPTFVKDKLELGISSNTETRELLMKHGWDVVEAIIPTEDPWTYRNYIDRSKGEWSIAKHGFVVSNCGFLSERTMNYMAKGKPAVIQDTGFSKYYPTGEGLLIFTTLQEAVAGIERANKDYAFHCRKAREFVEAFCSYQTVLGKLLDEAS
jgi:hypothetical protein